jgi:hypothetical protein
VLDLHDRLLINLLVLPLPWSILEVWKQRNVPCWSLTVRVGLELFHVSTEEPTSDRPPLELWECVRGHRMHFVSKKEESKSEAENSGGPL